jgi:hypothetical protein
MYMREENTHGKHIILGFENYDLVKIKTSTFCPGEKENHILRSVLLPFTEDGGADKDVTIVETTTALTTNVEGIESECPPANRSPFEFHFNQLSRIQKCLQCSLYP